VGEEEAEDVVVVMRGLLDRWEVRRRRMKSLL
jgi:hypothetical protein